jgi:endonuclease/exonuclease/phosphatase family metal-dependent hydrolase
MKKSKFKKPFQRIYMITLDRLLLGGSNSAVKQSFLCLLLILVSIFSFGQVKSEKQTKKNETVLMTYNVRNCFGVDGKIDYQRIAGIINRVNPRVLALQELDSATQRSEGKVVLDTLAGQTKMYHVYGPSIDYLGGKYGIGVLTRDKPVAWKIIPLPGREEKRCMLIVELEDFVFCCTHLSLNPEDRLRSTEIINEQFNGSTKPVFLAGDFNTLPESEPIKNLKTRWQMLNNPANATIPSDYPRRCIDYIFLLNSKNQKIKIVNSFVENEPVASDHRPVWVTIIIKK